MQRHGTKFSHLLSLCYILAEPFDEDSLLAFAKLDGFVFEITDDDEATEDLDGAKEYCAGKGDGGALASVDTEAKADAIKEAAEDAGITAPLLFGTYLQQIRHNGFH